MHIAISTMTTQGQVSIPSAVRKLLHLQPGSKLVWDVDPAGNLTVAPAKSDIATLFDRFPDRVPEATIDKAAAIGDYMLERYGRH